MVLAQISKRDHLFVEVRETVGDAEHARDYVRDVCLDWLVVEGRRSILRERSLNGVQKNQELAAAVLVEEQVEYHWRCLPLLWLGSYLTRNRFVWSRKHFEG